MAGETCNHIRVTVASRSAGYRVVAAAAYRSAEQLFDETYDMTHDYTRKRDVYESEILVPPHLQNVEWANSKEELWNRVEAKELESKRAATARLYREVMIPLPYELDADQRQELTRAYATKEFTSKGMIADISWHNFSGEKPDSNPHAHIMLTMREATPDGFGKKVREWDKQQQLVQWRENWTKMANDMASHWGVELKLDSRSYAERGINQIPEQHMGSAACKMEERGEKTYIGELNRSIREQNKELKEALEDVQAKTPRLSLKEVVNEIERQRANDQHSTASDQYQELYDQRFKSGTYDELGLLYGEYLDGGPLPDHEPYPHVAKNEQMSIHEPQEGQPEKQIPEQIIDDAYFEALLRVEPSQQDVSKEVTEEERQRQIADRVRMELEAIGRIIDEHYQEEVEQDLDRFREDVFGYEAINNNELHEVSLKSLIELELARIAKVERQRQEEELLEKQRQEESKALEQQRQLDDMAIAKRHMEQQFLDQDKLSNRAARWLEDKLTVHPQDDLADGAHTPDSKESFSLSYTAGYEHKVRDWDYYEDSQKDEQTVEPQSPDDMVLEGWNDFSKENPEPPRQPQDMELDGWNDFSKEHPEPPKESQDMTLEGWDDFNQKHPDPNIMVLENWNTLSDTFREEDRQLEEKLNAQEAKDAVARHEAFRRWVDEQLETGRHGDDIFEAKVEFSRQEYKLDQGSQIAVYADEELMAQSKVLQSQPWSQEQVEELIASYTQEGKMQPSQTPENDMVLSGKNSSQHPEPQAQSPPVKITPDNSPVPDNAPALEEPTLMNNEKSSQENTQDMAQSTSPAQDMGYGGMEM